jgi:hypothetical protein
LAHVGRELLGFALPDLLQEGFGGVAHTSR